MTVTEKLAHAAERKAFETMLDSLIRKSRTQDVGKVADDLVSMVQRIHSSVWEPETFAMLHKIANDPNSKWAHYAERLLRECDPYLLRTFLTAAAYEGGFRGFQQARANSEKYDCNIPWIVLMDPTSACNMRCAGCWAAEYGYKQNLTFEEMDRVLTEGAALGTHACLFTGGEPLMRKADIFRLCEKHRDMRLPRLHQRHAHRPGVLRRAASAWATSSSRSASRASRTPTTAAAARAILKRRSRRWTSCTKTAFRSACPSATRVRTTGSSRSDEFLDLLISKGCYFAWYFHYMPVGMGAATDLLLTPEQRAYMKDRRARDPRSHRRQGRSSPSTSRTTASSRTAASPAASSTATSTPRATSSPASSSTTPARTSAKRASSKCLRQPLFLAYHEGPALQR